MQISKKSAFTLVELIVVITILAILGTIAFISLQGYSRDARDSTRTADLNNIKTSLELYSLQTGNFPKPDLFSTITYSGGTENVWYQGILGDQVTTNLKSLNEKPLDPLTNTPYIYSVTNSFKEYEVLALYEGNVSYNSIINQTNAATTSLTPKVDGNYNGIFVKTTNYIIPTPSIITAESGNIILDGINIRSQVITNGTNIPKNSLTKTKTGALTGFKLKAFTGTIIQSSIYAKKVEAITQIQQAYSGSTLATNQNIKYLLNQTGSIKKSSLADILILKLPVAGLIKDWRSKDLNCDIPDIIVGNQTWAGCNSTLGSIAIEYNQTNCYDFSGNTMGCTNPPYGKTVSSMTENEYLSGNGNNIFGSLYEYDQMDMNSCLGNNISSDNILCPCIDGYHVPTHTEWDSLEVSLGCTNKFTANDGTQSGWECSNIGGMINTNKNTFYNKLGLPVAGSCSNGGINCALRGSYAYYRSSDLYGSNSSLAWYRGYRWYYGSIYRWIASNNASLSVRCIKD